MANFVYNMAKVAFALGQIDLENDDIRVLLVMTNTTADTEDDTEYFVDFTTLDEYDGSAYVRKQIVGQNVSLDAANNRAEFDGDDVTWTALGAGTRSCQAAIVYKSNLNSAGVEDFDISQPLFHVDSGGFPFAGNGGNVTFTWNAEGIAQVTSTGNP